MPRASKFGLKQKQFEEINSHLLYLISSLNNDNDIKEFLESFLTKEEKVMLTKRLALFMFLKKEYSPSIIKSILHVSYETIRIYQNQLSSKNQVFQKIMGKLIRRQQAIDLFNKINQILNPINLALNSKTNMKSRAKLASGRWTK